jgi:hypothetical protein
MMSRDDGHVRPRHPVIEPIRVLIADDEALVRDGFRVLITGMAQLPSGHLLAIASYAARAL